MAGQSLSTYVLWGTQLGLYYINRIKNTYRAGMYYIVMFLCFYVCIFDSGGYILTYVLW